MKSTTALLVLLATATTSVLGFSSSVRRSPVTGIGRITPNLWANNTALGLRLIRLGEDDEPVWMTEEQTFDLIRAKKGFVNNLLCSFQELCINI